MSAPITLSRSDSDFLMELVGESVVNLSAAQSGRLAAMYCLSSPNDGHWITISGEHVMIRDGAVVKGPAALMGQKHGDLKGSLSHRGTGTGGWKKHITEDGSYATDKGHQISVSGGKITHGPEGLVGKDASAATSGEHGTKVRKLLGANHDEAAKIDAQAKDWHQTKEDLRGKIDASNAASSRGRRIDHQSNDPDVSEEAKAAAANAGKSKKEYFDAVREGKKRDGGGELKTPAEAGKAAAESVLAKPAKGQAATAGEKKETHPAIQAANARRKAARIAASNAQAADMKANFDKYAASAHAVADNRSGGAGKSPSPAAAGRPAAQSASMPKAAMTAPSMSVSDAKGRITGMLGDMNSGKVTSTHIDALSHDLTKMSKPDLDEVATHAGIAGKSASKAEAVDKINTALKQQHQMAVKSRDFNGQKTTAEPSAEDKAKAAAYSAKPASGAKGGTRQPKDYNYDMEQSASTGTHSPAVEGAAGKVRTLLDKIGSNTVTEGHVNALSDEIGKLSKDEVDQVAAKVGIAGANTSKAAALEKIRTALNSQVQMQVKSKNFRL